MTPLSGVAEAEACPQRSVVVYTVIFGKVTEVRGAPIAGAVVSSPEDWTTTNAEGHYSIRVDSQCPAELWASHSLYAAQYLYIENPLLASPIPQNFVLPFRLTTSVTPSAFNNNPQKTLTFTTYTTAPQVGTRSIVQLPDGSVLELANVTSDLAGWTKWAGTWTVPAGTPDGRYTYKSCALDELATGNCDSVVGALLSEVRAELYAVDRVAPRITSTFPIRSGDVLQLSKISATWADAVSGIDPSSLKIWVDGAPVVTSLVANTVSTPGSGITPGIHRTDLEGRDKAGNVTTDWFEFTLVTLTAGPASATLAETTVSVNPSGAIPPPSSVTFRQPRVQVEAFSESINATTWVGYGQIKRPFSLGATDVVFNNETGVPATVRVPLPTGNAVHNLAALARSEQGLKATVPAGEVVLPDIIVEVPTGYNTAGSTARLIAASASLSQPASGTQYFLQNEIPIGGDPPIVNVTSHTGVRVVNGDGGLGVTKLEGRVEANYIVDSQPVQVLLTDPGDESFSFDPTIECGRLPQPNPQDIACVATKKKILLTRSYFTISRQAGFGFYSNNWLYRDSETPTYLAWHQVSSRVYDACVGGRTLQPRLVTMTTESSQILIDPASQKSSWKIGAAAYSSGGTEETTGRITVTPKLAWGLDNSISNTAEYSKAATVEPIPIQDGIGPTSTGTKLYHTSNDPLVADGLRNTTEQLILGARYDSRSGLDQAVEIWAKDVWRIEVAHASC